MSLPTAPPLVLRRWARVNPRAPWHALDSSKGIGWTFCGIRPDWWRARKLQTQDDEPRPTERICRNCERKGRRRM